MGAFDRLFDVAALTGPGPTGARARGDSDPGEAVRAYRSLLSSDQGAYVGSLVVADDRLAELGRAAGHEPVDVSVVITGGAGGLVALARREVRGVRVLAAEAALRDFDDLAGNAARTVAAAEGLGEAVNVFVEIPFAPGWLGAVEEVEAAGLLGKITIGDASPEGCRRLAEQLSGLVEADLSFKVAGDLHRGWPTGTGHGFVTLMLALDALIDGATQAEVADLLMLTDHDRIRAALAQWDDATGIRIRRQLRSISSVRIEASLADLRTLALP